MSRTFVLSVRFFYLRADYKRNVTLKPRSYVFTQSDFGYRFSSLGCAGSWMRFGADCVAADAHRLGAGSDCRLGNSQQELTAIVRMARGGVEQKGWCFPMPLRDFQKAE